MRREAGLSQEETARRAHISRKSLSMIENGQRRVNVDTLQAILYVLGYYLALHPYTPEERAFLARQEHYGRMEAISEP